MGYDPQKLQQWFVGYTTRKAPAFYNLGNGSHAMDSLAAVYGFTKPIWQQQVDGKVFVGIPTTKDL